MQYCPYFAHQVGQSDGTGKAKSFQCDSCQELSRFEDFPLLPGSLSAKLYSGRFWRVEEQHTINDDNCEWQPTMVSSGGSAIGVCVSGVRRASLKGGANSSR